MKGIINEGNILQIEKGRVLEVWVDADLQVIGTCHSLRTETLLYQDVAVSFLYEGCPILHKYQIQTENSLSSTESEYTDLSYAEREAIPSMILLIVIKCSV